MYYKYIKYVLRHIEDETLNSYEKIEWLPFMEVQSLT